MKPVEPVLKNISQNNTCRKDLSWPHFDDEPRVQEKQQRKDQQSCIFVFVACLTWAYKWKMSKFSPNKNNQAQEVVFSRKQSKPQHPRLLFNNVPVGHSSLQKHFVVHLVEKLSFSEYIKAKIQKAGIEINVIKNRNNLLHRQFLLTIYKLFVITMLG